MTILESLLIESHVLQDYFVDKTTSEALAGGVITLYKDNQRQTLKNWYYQDGVYPDYSFKALPNPMVLSSVGTIQDVNGNDVIPFFYPYVEDGSTNTETYYITVDNSNGQRQFTRQNFPYLASGESGTDIPTYQNLIVNGRFWRNITKISGAPNYTPQTTDLTNETNLVVCPSQHDGFHQPDIRFIKNITGGADSLTFYSFSSGSDPFENAIRPEYYLSHLCTSAISNDVKYYQFPISLHLKTLDSVDAVSSILAKGNDGNSNNKITLKLVKYYGSDTNNEDVKTIGTELSLTESWTRQVQKFTFPSSANFAGSQTGDDAYYLRIELPTGKTFNLSFAIPSIYLGSTVPTTDFESYDKIDAIINDSRTGDVRFSLDSQSEGWVAVNGGSIGSFSSSATAFNDVTTWPLYKKIYLKIPDFWAPVTGGRTTSGTPEENAIADFTANKTMTLPLSLGQVLVGSAPQFETDISFTVNITTTNALSVNTTNNTITFTNIGSLQTGDILQLSTTGTLPGGLSLSTNYYLYVVSGNEIAFHHSLYNAINDSGASSRIDLTSAGSGTISIVNTDISLTLSSSPGYSLIPGTPVILNQVGTLPGGLSAASVYYINSRSSGPTVYSLSSSFENAVLGYAINFTSNGAGANTMQSALGASIGESDHVLISDELASHRHSFSIFDNNSGPPNTASVGDNGSGTFKTYTDYDPNYIGATGNNAGHNTIQRSFFGNVYIKL